MPLSQQQRERIVEEAERRGVDPEKLLAEAERLVAEQTKAGQDEGRTPSEAADKGAAAAKSGELKPLYQYHLPFVRVNEVREIWLGLPPIDGGEEIASKWAARQLASEGATAPAHDAAPSGDATEA